jgi:MFS family permease
LIFWQSWMLGTVAILSVLTFAGVISPWTLLVLTFLLNIGAAMNGPGWQAIVPELVPRAELPDAISTNSAGFNLARAVGPALGGLMVAAFVLAARGAGIVFLLNSASFIAVIIVLYRWRRSPPYRSALPSERMFGSMRAGIRYIRYVPELQAILVRAFLFTFFASAAWALLAVVAEQDLHRGAMAYGILTGCLGFGAVIGASLLPRIRRRVSADMIGALSGGVFACTLAALAMVRSVPIIVVWLIAAGFAWTSMTSTMNVAVQLSVPAWVQARALGTYQMIFMGGMALGSVLWGFLAGHFSTSRSLLVAAISLVASLPVAHRFHMLRGKLPDLSPYQLNRPAPQVVIEPHPEAGPVMVTIEYRIRLEDYAPFTHAVHACRPSPAGCSPPRRRHPLGNLSGHGPARASGGNLRDGIVARVPARAGAHDRVGPRDSRSRAKLPPGRFRAGDFLYDLRKRDHLGEFSSKLSARRNRFPVVFARFGGTIDRQNASRATNRAYSRANARVREFCALADHVLHHAGYDAHLCGSPQPEHRREVHPG